MKLIYFTSKRYPSSTADHLFVRKMAEAFTAKLGRSFTFLVAGKLAEELSKTNARPVKAPRRGRSVFYFFWFPIFVLSSGLNDEETVFFSNDPKLLSVLIFWKKFFRRYAICSDCHRLWGDRRDFHIASHSRWCVATSETLKNLLAKAGTDSKKIMVARGGVELAAYVGERKSFHDLHPDLVEDDVITVGYVGFFKTMGLEKGIDTMIRALPFISDKRVKMIFVGKRKEDGDQYESLARSIGALDRCVFLPAVPPEKVPVYQKAIDLLVIPYPDEPHFRDFGFPMKVYEYMASGRPIIFSNLPIISEVLGEVASSFIAGNEKDLAEKTESCLTDGKRGSQLARLALEKVREYTWEKRAESIINLLS